MSDEAEIKKIGINPNNFEEKLCELKDLVVEIEKITDILKGLNEKHESLSWSLAQYMLSGSIKKIMVGGTMFTQKERVFSKVEDKEALRQWIAENDAVDLLMAVHPSKLTAYCNEQLESGGETPTGVNPNNIKYYTHCK